VTILYRQIEELLTAGTCLTALDALRRQLAQYDDPIDHVCLAHVARELRRRLNTLAEDIASSLPCERPRTLH